MLRCDAVTLPGVPGAGRGGRQCVTAGPAVPRPRSARGLCHPRGTREDAEPLLSDRPPVLGTVLGTGDEGTKPGPHCPQGAPCPLEMQESIGLSRRWGCVTRAVCVPRSALSGRDGVSSLTWDGGPKGGLPGARSDDEDGMAAVRGRGTAAGGGVRARESRWPAPSRPPLRSTADGPLFPRLGTTTSCTTRCHCAEAAARSPTGRTPSRPAPTSTRPTAPTPSRP